jgi:hypothetical protein
VERVWFGSEKTVWFGMLSKLQLVKTFIETSATQVNKSPHPYTDKKENQIFLIYKEIHNGAVAKPYMTNGSSCMFKYFCIFHILGSPSSYIYATAPFRISLYRRKIFFSFLSAYSLAETPQPSPAFGLISEGAIDQPG